MKRYLLGLLVAAAILLAACSGDCDPATQPCDVDLSTRKPPVQQKSAQNCEWINGTWFCH